MRYIMRLGADVIIIQFSETEMHVEHWKKVALKQETEEWQAHIFFYQARIFVWMRKALSKLAENK